jgi:predicted RNase H-like HicB family nuclease
MSKLIAEVCDPWLHKVYLSSKSSTTLTVSSGPFTTLILKCTSTLENTFSPSKALQKKEVSFILLEEQEEGGFVAYSSEYPGAVGQGETEKEALKDLEEAIQVLKEYLEQKKNAKVK